MTTTITAQNNPRKIAYREAGKSYASVNTGEAGAGSDGPYPYEEVTLAPGDSITLPEGAELVHDKEITPVDSPEVRPGEND